MESTQPEEDPEIEREFSMLRGERVDDGVYRLMGLPTDARSFKDADCWVEMKTAFLKVNGVGFSAPTFEFSEHETTITVKQDSPGASARIEW